VYDFDLNFELNLLMTLKNIFFTFKCIRIGSVFNDLLDPDPDRSSLEQLSYITSVFGPFLLTLSKFS